MVYLKLIDNNDGKIRYSYQPERHGEEGVLLFDTKSNKTIIEKLAENDGKPAFYRDHAFSMIKNNLNNLPKEKLLLWY